MARLATSAVQLCQRLQEMYPQKLQLAGKQSEQSSPFRRWTTGNGAGSSYRQHDHRNMYGKQVSEGCATTGPGGGSGGAGGGGVARWSLGLEQLLADPAGAAAFAHFLDKEFAAENINFWWSCEQFRCCAEGARRESLAHDIWRRHLAEGAAEPVNVDAAARRAAAARLHHDPPPQDLFVQAQKQIFNVMKFDSYPRFLRSAVHAECARADLRGLPPPYAPRADTPPKLKKSASNASERRRSGGSLLPWKRTASRERDCAPEDAPPPLITDVVKAGAGAGAAALCRLALPDGASTVVGLRAESVRALVDRLLQRRNLRLAAYDVLLRDEQGGSHMVDPSLPSSVLGGRCAVVERRVVLRVQLGARAVCVRCRPARRLRHVLRPLLRRYCPPDTPPALAAPPALPAAPAPHSPRAHAVLRDGAPVHPDTLVQELDGSRLQVVEVAQGAALALPDDHDERDDAQSVEYMTASVSSCGGDVFGGSTGSLAGAAGASGASPAASTASAASGDSGGSCGSGGSAGRVRAALRPGPPLHHHPPEFLENLRETQRQRLSPRTPPPLPPKPAHRPPPTVV